MQINSRQIRTHELSFELISSVITKLKLCLVVLLERSPFVCHCYWTLTFFLDIWL